MLNLKIRINGVLKDYADGWIRVNGTLRKIEDMNVKVNGELKSLVIEETITNLVATITNESPTNISWSKPTGAAGVRLVQKWSDTPGDIIANKTDGTYFDFTSSTGSINLGSGYNYMTYRLFCYNSSGEFNETDYVGGQTFSSEEY